MQIDLLDTFLDLAETRSFHRTAERLRITQSTVSARVTALEQAVGSRLFDRSRAGTDLTPEGQKQAEFRRAARAHSRRLKVQTTLFALAVLAGGIVLVRR